MTTAVDPRLAIVSALNTPPYDSAAGVYATPLGEAVQLLDAYQAAVLLEAAAALECQFGVTPATVELRLMSAKAQQPAGRSLGASEEEASDAGV